VVAWPARLGAGLLAGAYQRISLLRPALTAIWLIGVLGWLFEDSGVTVPAAALPFLLPLVAVILSSVPRSAQTARSDQLIAVGDPRLSLNLGR
jgi:hypothetical protein